MRILFLTLKCFSATGGIEKFNRAFSKALAENADSNGWKIQVLSAYDTVTNEDYLHKTKFMGCGGNRPAFMLKAIGMARKAEVVIFGHINLAPLANLMEVIFPRNKRIILTHGREVWESLGGRKTHALQHFHQTWTVSNYTGNILVEKKGVARERLRLFPNTLDPYFIERAGKDTVNLRDRYGITPQQKVILTVARLANTEKFKGYDAVLEILPLVAQQIPAVKYVLCGKWDEAEKNRINELIEALNLHNLVVLTGYVEDSALAAHYKMADLFVLPSRKEGFGIVFLEAAWCGIAVVGGNADGSVEALMHGKLGTLIDPADRTQLSEAIINALGTPSAPDKMESNQELIMKQFGFPVFKERQTAFLKEVMR